MMYSLVCRPINLPERFLKTLLSALSRMLHWSNLGNNQLRGTIHASSLGDLTLLSTLILDLNNPQLGKIANPTDLLLLWSNSIRIYSVT